MSKPAAALKSQEMDFIFFNMERETQIRWGGDRMTQRGRGEKERKTGKKGGGEEN